ncbi:Por secretion system C-terminal sorting domain-containing protein [Chryseobacterium soldanellicola]|uniref:Por secretion system C-terminal sorting domain-containing protein n=2 Tax=Chryseobacterium soldanellicola TaxID=311333 RepID=A0A1H1AIJ9_9FLAO|nr:Por secretion system C-terminal sorting domain-containing protein [Chryseobacterium soldanellicola]
MIFFYIYKKNIMKKLLLSLSILFTGALAHSQTVLLNENFDSYTDFVITGFGNWQTLDLDQLNTYTGGTDNPLWDNAGAPMAYQIFNPTTAGVTNATSGTELRNFDPHSGQKYAACWAGVPDIVTANNDWLVSPAVTLGATANQLSLWVKSMSSSYGLEKYKIGVYVGSGTPTTSANFTIISGATSLSAPYPNWEQKIYSLDAYAGQTVRIGIQCVSADTYMFMVDDVKITTGTLATNEVGAKTKSTSVYPNPTKGEINIKTDKKIKSSSVLDASGRSVLTSTSQKVDISSLPKGVYLVKVDFTDGTATTEKVIKE